MSTNIKSEAINYDIGIQEVIYQQYNQHNFPKCYYSFYLKKSNYSSYN